MKATKETIAKAVKLDAEFCELRGQASGLKEYHLAIFDEEELVEMNKEMERRIERLKASNATASTPTPITVKLLRMLCDEQIKKGNGDKVILMSDDDEGNGFHTMFFAFTDEQAVLNMFAEEGLFNDKNDPKKVVILG